MTGRYPCITKCPNCRKDVKFFLGSIHGGGKKCPRCDIKLILPGSFSASYYDNESLLERNSRLIHSYEKLYFTKDGNFGSEFLRVCPHGFWRYER